LRLVDQYPTVPVVKFESGQIPIYVIDKKRALSHVALFTLQDVVCPWVSGILQDLPFYYPDDAPRVLRYTRNEHLTKDNISMNHQDINHNRFPYKITLCVDGSTESYDFESYKPFKITRFKEAIIQTCLISNYYIDTQTLDISNGDIVSPTIFYSMLNNPILVYTPLYSIDKYNILSLVANRFV
jgi:hypothetical protein